MMTIEELITILKIECATKGDKAQVEICDLALAGDVSARRECVRLIESGAGDDDDTVVIMCETMRQLVYGED